MGAFKDFVKNKLNEEAKKISSNLLKNIIDVTKEYILTEYDLSEDEKMQIINNMQLGVEEHDRGILKKGPKFVIASTYDGGEGKKVPVEIVIEIVTEKIGQKQQAEPAEEPEMPAEEMPEEGEEEEMPKEGEND